MKWLWLALTLPLVLIAGGFLLNRVPLFSAPGALERLTAYLTTNVAETRPDHPFPELRTPTIPVDVEVARDALAAAVGELGWKEVEPTENGLRAVVVSPLFRFRDDVSVRLEPVGGATALHARSASRVGKGDLGANTAHLMALFAAVKRLAAPRESAVAD